MAYFAGILIGTMFGFALASAIVGLFFFKKDPPFPRAWKTGLASFVLIFIVAGLGKSDSAGFALLPWISYLPAGTIVMLLWYLRYKALWTDNDDAQADQSVETRT